MKRLSILFLLLVVGFSLVSASESNTCYLTTTLLNQDPYPAVPGEYVKLVFQVDGLSDPSCGDVTFQLLDKYPISFDASSESKVSFKAGTFAKDFSSHAIIPFKVRLDSDALDGDNPIEVIMTERGNTNFYLSRQFNITVENVKADFEIYVKDFNSLTNKINLEVLNIAESDVEAVTVEIMNADELGLKGAKTRIIGDLDSNEYTTAEFEISPSESNVELKIYYTDVNNVRRSSEETVMFYPSNFENRKADQKESSPITWIVLVIVVVGIGYWIYKRKKKKN